MESKKYIIDNPDLMAEWDWGKNNELGLDPNKLTYGSGKKAWWKCSKGHEWQAMISKRTIGHGCLYCSGQKVLKGHNDLQTLNPTLSKEWNYEKNGDLKPDMVMPNSNKKVWWKCEKGHEWQTTIALRNNGNKCPYCSGRYAIKGENDLQTVNPTLAQEWNYEKNGDLKPDMITSGSGKKVWWKCKKGHEWQTIIRDRNRGSGCPYCSGNQVLKGYNDLTTTNPKLTIEWNREKNGDLKPDMVTSGSERKVWWKCKKGHEWQALIKDRSNGTGCPICSSELQTSFPEQAIYFYIKKIFSDAINRDCHLGMELDIYIPSKKFAIEYDGAFWHKDKQRDERKNKLCRENKITLIRVKEDTRHKFVEDEYLKIIPCASSDKGLEDAIDKILVLLNKNIDVNIEKDRADIYTSFINMEKEQSLSVLNSDLAVEWNYEKNGDFQPDMVAANSGKKVWWKCKKGHEWQANIKNRNKGIGCPYCSGRYAIKGENDLQTVYPTLSKEWNYEKNNGLTPMDVLPNSNKKVWWKCHEGHEWQATVSNRTMGRNCPYCSNKKILKGYNDLQTLNPALAKEWNYEKNGDLKPSMVTSGSEKKVWWKCSKGHEWQASIYDRNKGNGCPYCSGQKILKGYNDLQTVNPTLAQEWNFEKNGDLKPSMVTSGSGKKVWWKCSKGHEWQAVLHTRNKGVGCPYCSGRYVIEGENDLQTVNPTLSKEWNYEKNGDLKPSMVTSGSGKKVWWKCSKGHEWQASIAHRSNGRGCPYCSGRYTIKGN